MRKVLAFVAMSSLAAPALAQPANVSAGAGTSQPTEAQPKMIKKKVCERVDNEETTGSRLSAAPKVCKIVTVPADQAKEERGR